MSNRAVGIFDSGLGGLTVAREIRHLLPSEQLVYLGDTARVPYGTRSASVVQRYAESCAKLLVRHQIKILVVACNTVSAVALPFLESLLDVPVLGVIEPGARAAVAQTKARKVGVIATRGTVRSKAYPRAIAALDPSILVHQCPAPLLVPLAEEGWTEGEVPALVTRRYMGELLDPDMDTLLLGCTHYPLLRDVIEAESAKLHGSSIHVVDSAVATAEELAELLARQALLRAGKGSLRMMVTDWPERFTHVAARFLGGDIGAADVEQVDL